MCELHDADIEDNWVLLDCIDKIPPEKKISDACENLVWSFKLEITRHTGLKYLVHDKCDEVENFPHLIYRS